MIILQLDYTAPEYALLGSITPAADMFSFGMVAYSVFTRHVLIVIFHTVKSLILSNQETIVPKQSNLGCFQEKCFRATDFACLEIARGEF